MIFRLPLQTNHTLILKSNHTRFNQTRRLRRFSIQDPLYFKCSESCSTCIVPNSQKKLFQTPNRFTTGFICNHMALEAWYMNDESDEDQRLPRHLNPKQFVSLSKLAGVTYWHLNPKNYENDEELKKIRESRGYNYMDLLDLHPERVENYEQKLKNFFTEHIHADEEIRYCLEGCGYFDVRDNDDRWIRIWIKEGDMIVLPAGIYHRFTLDTSNYVKLMRLFIGEPVWTCYNRPQEEHPARKGYVKNVVEKAGVAVEAH